MLARELISDSVPAVRTSDTGMEVLDMMDTLKVSHLPIVNHRNFLGLISDSDIYSLEDQGDPIGAHALSLFSPFVQATQHVVEVLEVVRRLKITVVPVLIGEDYLGSITQMDLLQETARLLSADQPGGILVFKMTIHDYSMTEMARIVEENQVRIMSSYIDSGHDSTEILVTIKLNTIELSSVIRSFERYDYTILGTFMEAGQLDEMYQTRYEEFMRYLNT